MKLTFIGGAGMATGSSYLVTENNGEKITNALIDCGLYQGSSFAEKLNFEPFAFDAKEIDAVFITHSHIDHIGRTPQLYKAGFKGKIYSTNPTKDFAEHLLLDSEHLLGKEAEEKNLPPLYSINDINETMKFWHGVDYHEKVKVGDLEFQFYDAGHILGSSFIVVTSKDGKKIIFSGDLGNVSTPIIKDTEDIIPADYVLIESTYGGRLHENVDNKRDILENLIEDTIKNKGTLMIPAFAMERTQALLFDINQLIEEGRIPRIPVFIDSPLAIKITDVYKKYSGNPKYFDQESLALLKKGDAIFNFPGLRFTLTPEQSKEINSSPAPKVIIAGSGMSQGGRILHHESRYLSDPKSTILFIGYQAPDSLGRHILDNAKSVRIFGMDISVRCHIKNISGYSAHADQKKLLAWLTPARKSIKKIFVVQGEEDQSEALAQKIRDELAIETMIPKVGDLVEI